jgi:hypothetical protein
MAPEPVEWVQIRGLPPSFALRLIMVASMFVAGALITLGIESTGGRPLSLGTLVELFSLLAVIGALLLVLSWIQTPRAVGLTPSGVILRFAHRRVTLPWHEIMNVRYVTGSLVVFQPLSGRANSADGAFDLTLDQARAILRDPRCPPVSMPEDLRRGIFSP